MIINSSIFGILSSLAILIGAVPYIKDVYLKKVNPHILSWLGWAFITGLAASAMYTEGSTWLAVVIFANTTSCLLIVLFSIFKGVGIWESSKFDKVFFGIGIFGLFLWVTLNAPILALICAIVADFSFGVPTIIKTYKKPNSETPFVWVMATVSGILSIFAIETIAFYEVAYPIYLLLFDTSVLLLVLGIIKSKKTP